MPHLLSSPSRSSAARASLTDTARVLGQVLLPLVARGLVKRRPRAVALLARLDADHRSVRCLQRVRARYGEGPVLLRLPRPVALVLAPDDVRRVLDQTPEPFSAAAALKVAALGHFEPGAVLISSSEDRPARRPFNEVVLEAPAEVHSLAGPMLAAVQQEADSLLDGAARTGEIAYPAFAAGTWRMVRRVVLGDAARDDEAFTDLLGRLRSRGNWGPLLPRREGLRREFDARLRHYLDAAEPGSLAGAIAGEAARAATGERTEPAQQVPHWLFAYDAAVIAAFRALALLDGAPEAAQRAAAEAEGAREPARSAAPTLPFLRACVLEALRLYPTTPALVRQSTAPTTWPDRRPAGGPPVPGPAVLPAGTALLVHAPFAHRDDERQPWADALAPELWLDGAARGDWPLVPFSAGPAGCPGRNLVLFTTSSLLARLLADHELRLLTPLRRGAQGQLPGTLDHFALRFAVRPR